MLDVQYHVIVARKGKVIDLFIDFMPIDFHHLMGLGKLKDLRVATQNREQVFQKILIDSITEETIKKSRYYSLIQNRFEPLAEIENILDDNRLVFHYNPNINYFSRIQADFLLSTEYNGNDVYVFISEKQENHYFCRSFFPKETTDYTNQQPVCHLIFKEKIYKNSGKHIILFDEKQ